LKVVKGALKYNLGFEPHNERILNWGIKDR